jgi:Kinesin motor domain
MPAAAGATAAASAGSSSSSVHAQQGLIPRAVRDLFIQLTHLQLKLQPLELATTAGTSSSSSNSSSSNSSTRASFTVHCSYLQIYNGKVYDLLADGGRHRALNIRETTTNSSTNATNSISSSSSSAAAAAVSGSSVYVQGLSEYRVARAEDVMLLLQQVSLTYYSVQYSTDICLCLACSAIVLIVIKHMCEHCTQQQVQSASLYYLWYVLCVHCIDCR